MLCTAVVSFGLLLTRLSMLQQVYLQEKHTMTSNTVLQPKELMLVLYDLRVRYNTIQPLVRNGKQLKRHNN